jgi:hypothetical protein
METQAIFENIAESIQQEIRKAKRTIFIAVAWFTNKDIFEELVAKAKEGCTINLMLSNDTINNESSIDFERLNIGNSKVFFVGDGDKELMHNKFCVIDGNTVITGSYNWSYKAEKNVENITITSGDQTLAQQFINEFNNIKQRYFPNEKETTLDLPIDKIIKRLEIIKNYILLEDIEEVDAVSKKLKEYEFNNDLKSIVDFIGQGKLSEAVVIIEKFITNHRQISFWIDPEIEALKLEIKILENQLVSFDNEKSELECILHDFQREHYLAIGDLILKLLNLRKLKYVNEKEKYEEAEKDEQEYSEQFEFEKEKDVFNLSDEEKKELTSCYRKAALLCHPDKFSQAPSEIQKQAEELMVELSIAKDKKDLARVKEILSDLEKGIISSRNKEDNTDKVKLKNIVNKLRDKVKKLEDDIIKIKLSEEFKLIVEIEDWNDYFSNVKQQIQNEIEVLKTEIESLD